MDGEKQVCLRQICNFGALLEGKVRIVLTRVNHLRSELVLDQLSQSLHDIEYQVFFQQSLASDCAQVPTAVAGIEHYTEPLRATLRSARGSLFLGGDRDCR